jgi:hypothetical protein
MVDVPHSRALSETSRVGRNPATAARCKHCPSGSVVTERITHQSVNDEPPLNPSLTRPGNYPPLFPDFVAYAQAIHMGEPEEKAPALQATPTGSLSAVSDSVPLSR